RPGPVAWTAAGLNCALVSLIQETYLRICAHRCRLLREFHFDAPEAILGYLKTVAFNATMDYVRGRAAAKLGSRASVHAIETYPEGGASSRREGPLPPAQAGGTLGGGARGR